MQSILTLSAAALTSQWLHPAIVGPSTVLRARKRCRTIADDPKDATVCCVFSDTPVRPGLFIFVTRIYNTSKRGDGMDLRLLTRGGRAKQSNATINQRNIADSEHSNNNHSDNYGEHCDNFHCNIELAAVQRNKTAQQLTRAIMSCNNECNDGKCDDNYTMHRNSFRCANGIAYYAINCNNIVK